MIFDLRIYEGVRRKNPVVSAGFDTIKSLYYDFNQLNELLVSNKEVKNVTCCTNRPYYSRGITTL
jgi:hypothetical protein